MDENKEWFEITSIHRDDLIKAGFDGNVVDDSTMELLASKMADDYMEQLFWIHLGIFADDMGIPKLKQKTSNY